MAVTPGYKATEIGPIPEDWEVRPFGELFSFKNGVNADKRAYGRGVRFINVLEPITYSHLFGPEIPGRVVLPESLLESFAVKKGDVLFNRTSETDSELGLAATFVGSERVVFGGFVIRGRPIDDSFDPIYSGYALRARTIRDQIIPLGQGAVRANIGQAALSRVLAPVPPLAEQRLIAGALNDADGLLDRLDKLIAKKRQLNHAAMQQLLSGRKRLPGFDAEWSVRRLGDVTVIDSDSLPSNTPPTFRFNYISLEDVDYGVLVNYSEQRFGTAPSRARRLLRDQDVLVGTVRPNLKSHLLFHDDGQTWVCSTGFCVVRCRDQVTHPSYVFFQLFGDHVARQIESLLTGSNYPAINRNDVRTLEIPLPSFAEQAAIAEVLSDIGAELAALQERREKTQALKQGMMQALLTGKTRLV